MICYDFKISEKNVRLFARENNCYKVILDCDENIKKVYSKNGFIIKGVQMAEYLVAEHPK